MRPGKLALPSGTRAACEGMGTLLWLGLLLAYGWSVRSLYRQMHSDPDRPVPRPAARAAALDPHRHVAPEAARRAS